MVDNGSPSCRRGKSGEARAAGEGNRGREKNPEMEMKGEEGKVVGLLCRWRNRRWDCRFHKTGEAGVGNAGFKFSQINETVNENAGFGILKKRRNRRWERRFQMF